MNDVGLRDRNDAINRDRQDNRTGDGSSGNRQTHQSHRRRRRWGGACLRLADFLLLGGGLLLGAWKHYSQHQDVAATAEPQRDFVPSLPVATVEASPGTVSVTLPGTTDAFAAANIFARATGYIAKRNVDVGDRVKAGNLLAQLAVPEIDDQISQNEATLDQRRSALDQAEAVRRLRQVTWDRDAPLVEKGWVTRQQGDVGSPEPQGTGGRSRRRET